MNEQSVLKSCGLFCLVHSVSVVYSYIFNFILWFIHLTALIIRA